MAKFYSLQFGTGDPRTLTGLSPTFLIFVRLTDGATIAPPTITEAATTWGIYQFSYGTTQPIAFLADAATTSPGTAGRYIVGQIDPADRADEYGTSLIALGTTGVALGTTSVALGITSVSYGSINNTAVTNIGTTLVAVGNTSIALGITSVSYGSANNIAITNAGTTLVAVGNTSISLGTTGVALGITSVSYGSINNTAITNVGTTLVAVGNTSIAYGGTTLFDVVNLGTTLVGIGNTVSALGNTSAAAASSLLALVGSTASLIGDNLTDPGTLFGYMKRVSELVQGQESFTKASGALSFYDRTGATLLNTRTITNSASLVTRT